MCDIQCYCVGSLLGNTNYESNLPQGLSADNKKKVRVRQIERRKYGVDVEEGAEGDQRGKGYLEQSRRPQPEPISDNTLIPYPRPPLSVELRSGVLYSGCQCVKRDGLQYDCPRTGCQGKASCMAFPAPECGPSGNAPLQEMVHEGGYAPDDYRAHPGRQLKGHKTPHLKNDGYIRLGKQGYRENPPVKPRRVPCQEHRKPRV
uniref:Uncharacterized protein n=1 Tax=Cuerna arida TaxID=1464854 RepID=A0A1B6G8X8_9HEMI